MPPRCLMEGRAVPQGQFSLWWAVGDRGLERVRGSGSAAVCLCALHLGRLYCTGWPLARQRDAGMLCGAGPHGVGCLAAPLVRCQGAGLSREGGVSFIGCSPAEPGAGQPREPRPCLQDAPCPAPTPSPEPGARLGARAGALPWPGSSASPGHGTACLLGSRAGGWPVPGTPDIPWELGLEVL